MRFFREKLQRRNVTKDIKHYEDCEQLFLSVGRAYTVTALLHFFGMAGIDDPPQNHLCPYDVIHGDGDKLEYLNAVLDKFVDEYLLAKTQVDLDLNEASDDSPDQVREYSLCLLRFFFILECIRQAVKSGNGDQLAALRKVLLKHFKSDPGHNTYAIEMLISILQDEVFLTKRKAHQTRWASTANWTGGALKNIEIDLLQENLNRELKKGIKDMGANKTPRSIERFSRAAGGIAEIIRNFDEAVAIKKKDSTHKHKSSAKDENLILFDLLELKPFEDINDRCHEGFTDVSSDTLATLNEAAFNERLYRHKKNIVKHGPVDVLSEDEDEL